MTEPDFDNAAFSAWLKRNPGGVYSQFSAWKVSSKLDQGTAHPTLGPKLQSEKAWHDSGLPVFNELLALTSTGPDDRICDYGCGSLRVGVHFIQRQNVGCYLGMDVTEDFIAYGRQLVGKELLEAKKPQLGSIARKLPLVSDFAADLVYCTHVAIHVHPDEKQSFADNLKQIACKPGSMAVFDVLLTPEPVRFRNSGWGWPIRRYLELMAPLVLNHIVYRREREGIGQEFFLVFQRP